MTLADIKDRLAKQGMAAYPRSRGRVAVSLHHTQVVVMTMAVLVDVLEIMEHEAAEAGR